MLRKVPLIVILGSTGTGKTKLSLELAERFGGEIISADSMQVYANLDIATAKATKEEQSVAKHHLLDVATPSEPFTVVNFRNAALPIIENLLAQSKCPIVVGGTNYYIESLLWGTLVSPKDGEAKGDTDENQLKDNHLKDDEIAAMSSAELHKHLLQIDPASANRMHPNNRRKIQRAIEVYQQTGQTLSEKLQEQRQQPGGNRLGGPLRYPHTVLFWLRCQQDVLDARLDKRVDSMVEQGLLHEIRTFYNEHIGDKSSPKGKTSASSSSSAAAAAAAALTVSSSAYTKGILQTIGFKEFIPYLEQFNAANDQKIEEYLRENAYRMPTEEHFESQQTHCDDADESSINAASPPVPPGLQLLKRCLDELKLVTRRYSKKQIKWINNRFLASKDRQVPPLYELDTSDVAAWSEKVSRPAATIVECYRQGQVCEIEPMAKREHPGAGFNEETSHYCGTCQRPFIGDFQWRLHLKSNKHKRRRESQRKLTQKLENDEENK